MRIVLLSDRALDLIDVCGTGKKDVQTDKARVIDYLSEVEIYPTTVRVSEILGRIKNNICNLLAGSFIYSNVLDLNYIQNNIFSYLMIFNK